MAFRHLSRIVLLARLMLNEFLHEFFGAAEVGGYRSKEAGQIFLKVQMPDWKRISVGQSTDSRSVRFGG